MWGLAAGRQFSESGWLCAHEGTHTVCACTVAAAIKTCQEKVIVLFMFVTQNTECRVCYSVIRERQFDIGGQRRKTKCAFCFSSINYTPE